MPHTDIINPYETFISDDNLILGVGFGLQFELDFDCRGCFLMKRQPLTGKTGENDSRQDLLFF